MVALFFNICVHWRLEKWYVKLVNWKINFVGIWMLHIFSVSASILLFQKKTVHLWLSVCDPHTSYLQIGVFFSEKKNRKSHLLVSSFKQVIQNCLKPNLKKVCIWECVCMGAGIWSVLRFIMSKIHLYSLNKLGSAFWTL